MPIPGCPAPRGGRFPIGGGPAVLLLLALAGCVTTREAVVRATRPEPAYDRLYPRVRLCDPAVTDLSDPENDEEYERFRAAYFAWAGRQLEDVQEKLAQLYGGR